MSGTTVVEQEVEETFIEEVGDLGIVEVSDNSKHRRLVVDVDGVPCERIWGYALFPVEKVKEFSQYCRDTDRKINDLVSPIITGGIEALFVNEIDPTADARAEARKTTALPNSEEALAKAEAKLLERQEKLAAQLEAVKARAAQLRGPEAEVPTNGRKHHKHG